MIKITSGTCNELPCRLVYLCDWYLMNAPEIRLDPATINETNEY